MFSSISETDIATVDRYIHMFLYSIDRLEDQQPYVCTVRYIRLMITHSNHLLSLIRNNALTAIVKENIIRSVAGEIYKHNSAMNNVLENLIVNITETPMMQLPEMKTLYGRVTNVIRLGKPTMPNVIISQLNGIPNSCGLHAVMHMLLSAGFTSNWFDFSNITHQVHFANGFNELNDGKMCTIDSEISDVLRSFCDMLSVFVNPRIFYAMICTKSLDYNFNDFFKHSSIIDYAIRNKLIDAVSEEYINGDFTMENRLMYDCSILHPEWVLFDSGIWVMLFEDNDIHTQIRIRDDAYTLHSFIVNRGRHYVCCVVDNIEAETCYVYDDMRRHIIQTNISNFPSHDIGAYLFHRDV